MNWFNICILTIMSLIFFILYAAGIQGLLSDKHMIDCFWANQVIEVSYDNISEFNVGQNLLFKPDAYLSKKKEHKLWRVEGSKEKNYIRVGFEKSTAARQIFIFENFNSGATYEVYISDTEGNELLVKTVYSKNTDEKNKVINIFLGDNKYKIRDVKLVIFNKENESYVVKIDAIGLC